MPAILSPDHVRRIPTVVSLDATPIQYDELGAHYGHDTGGRAVERLKWKANRACFAGAAAVVAWAEWTKAGLVDRYEVPADKVVVIPPGVDYARWSALWARRGRPTMRRDRSACCSSAATSSARAGSCSSTRCAAYATPAWRSSSTS